MSTDAASDAFLSGQGIPVDLSKIETELSHLWGPAAEREGGPTDLDRPTVTRVSLANLVFVDLCGGDAKIDSVLDSVVAHYPCRAIVLRRQDSVGKKVAADIAALCHLPAPGLPQVCSERINLYAGHDGLSLLPGAVRPLLEADQPMILVWVGDPSATLSLFREFATSATRVIVDLPDPGADPKAVVAALDLGVNQFTRDLAWFGATRWRELVAGFFDPIGQEKALASLTSVTITVESPTLGHPPRVAAWLASWLAGQLGWTNVARTQVAPDRFESRFQGPNGEILVAFKIEHDPSASFATLAGVALTSQIGSNETTYRLVRLANQVAVEIEASETKRLPRVVQLVDYDQAGRVSASLESARDDPPYRKALPHLSRLISE